MYYSFTFNEFLKNQVVFFVSTAKEEETKFSGIRGGVEESAEMKEGIH